MQRSYQYWCVRAGTILFLATFGHGLRAQTQVNGAADSQPQVCAANANIATPEPNIVEWCTNYSEFDKSYQGINGKISDFQKRFRSLNVTSPEALQGAKDYTASLKTQLDQVLAIRENIRAIIEMYGLLPLLPDSVAQTEAANLATLQSKQLELIAKYELSQRIPTAVAAGGSANTAPPPKATEKPTPPSPPDKAPSTPKAVEKPTTPNPKQGPQPKQNSNATPANNEIPNGVSSTTTVPVNNGGIVINATSVNAAQSPQAPAEKTPDTATAPSTDETAAPPKTTNNKGAASVTAQPSSSSRSPGMLSGRILDDQDGWPIGNATVIVKCGTNGEYKDSTKSDRHGEYVFASVPPGNCLVRASKSLSPKELDSSIRQCDVYTQESQKDASDILQKYQADAHKKSLPWPLSKVSHEDLVRSEE